MPMSEPAPNKYTTEDLREMQGWSLERKIQVTQTRILEWYIKNNGNVYVSFSGGKDSTVLLDLARRVRSDIPAVFIDTGLEYPEIKAFVKTKENVIVLRPKMTFKDVISKYGYPIFGKNVAHSVYYAQHGKDWAIKQLSGFNADGTISKFNKRFKKYEYLINADFPISDNCCSIIKKSPAHTYNSRTKRKPILATMTEESQLRQKTWLKNGCNAFEAKYPVSNPMSFWTEQDVLHYLKETDIPYSPIYGDIVKRDCQMTLFDSETDALELTGYQRTGCMFCCFGIACDKSPNRFQRMKQTHPKLYDYCLRGGCYDEQGIWMPDKNGLGMAHVLDYIGIPY